jgi:short-subunit dehydrogenase
MKLAQARVLLTGASGGIGQAMAAELRRAGAQVMGVGRGAGASGEDHVQADLTTPQGVSAVTLAAARWKANVVVHGAGIAGFGALSAVAPQDMAAVLQTNLLAPMLLTQALLPQLLAQPHAQVVFVGSALGRIGLPGFSVYGASKSGLHGFAEALRRELAGGPVKVQILAPRSTRTLLNDAAVMAYNQATGTATDPPQRVAEALCALIESEVAERFIGFPERFAVRINGLLGAGLDGSFTRHRQCLAQTQTLKPEGAAS